MAIKKAASKAKPKKAAKKAKKNPVKVTIRRNGETKTLYGAAAQKVLDQRKGKSKKKNASPKKNATKKPAKKSATKGKRHNSASFSKTTPAAVRSHKRDASPNSKQASFVGKYFRSLPGGKTPTPAQLKALKSAAAQKNPRYLVADQYGNDLGILVAPNATQAMKRAKGFYPGAGKLTATKVAQADFIGGRTDLLKKARAQQAKKTAKKATVKKSPTRSASKPATRGSVARRNPDAGAIYEAFTGMPSTGYDVVTAPHGTPANVDELGQLLRFHWVDWEGNKFKVDLEKMGIPALLAVNRNKDGYDTLYALGDWVLDSPPGDHGLITRIEYRAQKAHLGDTSPRVYYHDLGEETGEPPVLRVDKEGHLIFRDGAYWIEDRGIVN